MQEEAEPTTRYIVCDYCGHEYKGPRYPCPECGPEPDAYIPAHHSEVDWSDQDDWDQE